MKCSILVLSFVVGDAIKDYALLLRLYITFDKNTRRTSWHRKSEKSHGYAEQEAT